MRILVVDDNQPQFIMIKNLLLAFRQDVQFEYAPNYRDALKAVDGERFDVFLIDYDLGGESGIELMKQLRRDGHDAPMILLTAHGSRDVDLQAMESGAVDYLDKGELRAAILERSIRYAVRYHESLRRIKESENRLRRVLGNIPTGVFIAQGAAFAFVNDALCQMTGYTAEELFDYPVENLLGESVAAMLAQNTPAGDAPRHSEMQFRAASGDVRWLQITLSRMQYEGEQSVLGAVTDITERKIAEQHEQEQRTLAEALLDTSRAINSTLEIDEVLYRILDNLRYVIPHDVATITMIEDGYTRVVGYTGDLYEREIRKTHLAIDDTPELRLLIENRAPLLIRDLQDAPNVAMFKGLPNLRSYLSTPLIAADNVIGFINLLTSAPEFFDEAHADRLQIFANQVVGALQNAREYEKASEKAANDERQRLAHDLHDAVSQTLFSASVIAESLPRLRHNEAAFEEGLRRISRMSRGALAEMRTLLLELRPQALVNTELDILLQHLVNAARSRIETEIDLVIHADTDKIILPSDVRVGFYRITQEALNNIIKHAQATKALIHVTDDAQQTVITITDDGRGFDPDVIPSDSLGLRIMQERAAKIELDLTIDSQPQAGSRISATYPKGRHDEREN